MTAPVDASSVEVRVYARFDGQGTAYDGARALAVVDYAIKDVDEVYHAVPEPGAPRAADQVIGPRTLFGILRTPQAAAFGTHVGSRLVLHLADGRQLDFTVAKVLGLDSLLIQGLGDVR